MATGVETTFALLNNPGTIGKYKWIKAGGGYFDPRGCQKIAKVQGGGGEGAFSFPIIGGYTFVENFMENTRCTKTW